MEALEAFLGADFFGIPVAALLALIIALAIACNEGIRYKFVQYKKTSGNVSAVFDKKYLISGFIAIIVCGATIWFFYKLVFGGVSNFVELDLTGQIEQLIVAFVAVLTEALVLIKTCNRRLDTLFCGGSSGEIAEAEPVKKEDDFELKTL